MLKELLARRPENTLRSARVSLPPTMKVFWARTWNSWCVISLLYIYRGLQRKRIEQGNQGTISLTKFFTSKNYHPHYDQNERTPHTSLQYRILVLKSPCPNLFSPNQIQWSTSACCRLPAPYSPDWGLLLARCRDIASGLWSVRLLSSFRAVTESHLKDTVSFRFSPTSRRNREGLDLSTVRFSFIVAA